nr:MAG TPA: hypothetical protein [Caudoviricetes sp.]
MPPYPTTGPGGPARHGGIHHLGRGGLCGAAHLGPGCRSRLAALALANRSGLGVPATPSVRRCGRGDGSERAGRQAADGERGQEEEEGGHSEEEDVGGADAHGELLRGSGGAGVWSGSGRGTAGARPGSGRGAGGLRSVRRLRCIRCLMCIRCLIRGNASRWLAKGTSQRAKLYQPVGRRCMGTTCR